MKIKIISKSGRCPEYATEGSAGFDLPAFLEEPVTLAPGERRLIPTGIFMEIPKGYEVQVRARSGLAVRNGIGLVNGIGTVDSDYRGELMVPLINFGQEAFTVENGQRIAQAVVARYIKADLELADSLDETCRGTGGFGHTGI